MEYIHDTVTNLDYESHATGPYGIRVRITRLAPNLDYDVAVTIPHDVSMTGVTDWPGMGTRIVDGAIIHHRSSPTLHEAMAWADRFTHQITSLIIAD
ncbi:hypothetical protein CSQ85_09245 [Bifidobacterium rousetti]|uniref:hypothetical protein n=1 Tax=Bifidobacterium rousetti TaxID=2045439 RepID=UPI00123B3FFB|nr:hypothetical protein [Bifidobacterium rousetti]KAA8818336.1 hypothetical protein CSQ85_09245 [Bifidobacterium rousetti]